MLTAAFGAERWKTKTENACCCGLQLRLLPGSPSRLRRRSLRTAPVETEGSTSEPGRRHRSDVKEAREKKKREAHTRNKKQIIQIKKQEDRKKEQETRSKKQRKKEQETRSKKQETRTKEKYAINQETVKTNKNKGKKHETISKQKKHET